MTDRKPLVTVPITRTLRELLRKGIISQRAKQSDQRPEGLILRTVHCIALSPIWDCKEQISLEHKEVDINNKKHARIRIWAFACEWHQTPESSFYFWVFFFFILLLHCSLRLLGWSRQQVELLSFYHMEKWWTELPGILMAQTMKNLNLLSRLIFPLYPVPLLKIHNLELP